jgi:predicted nucleic acid-binding protein
MTTLVIGSSVAIKWFVVEPYSADARRLLDGYQEGNLRFVAPDLINAEVGNILWKKHVVQGMAASDAQEVLNEFQAVPIRFISTAVLLDAAYRIAVTHRRTVYDALYLALSEKENCPMITSDERLVNAVSGEFLNLIWLPKWQ